MMKFTYRDFGEFLWESCASRWEMINIYKFPGGENGDRHVLRNSWIEIGWEMECSNQEVEFRPLVVALFNVHPNLTLE